MKAEILNKRKAWLNTIAAQSLDNWSKRADALQGFPGTLKYFGIKQSRDGFEIDSSDANSCFRQSLELFKVVLQKQFAKENIGFPVLDQLPVYDALITIVGFSPEPLMHTVLALAPKKVYPVATEESAKDFYKVPLSPNTRKPDGIIGYFEIVIALYKESQQKITIEPIGRNVASVGSMDTFKRVREIIKEVKKNNTNANIAIDISGGKKSADVSAFLVAAIEEDIDIYYVDFEDYNDTKVCCGTEFLNKLDNPYEIYNIQLLNQAKELFRSYNYQVAFQLFSLIDSKLSSEGMSFPALYGLDDEREKVAKMKLASIIYMYWDRFDYADANDKGGTDFQNIAIVKSLVLPENIKSIYEVDDQFEYVKKICIDRYANADRRYEQGRYEDALTRYSQSLEMACKSYLIRLIVSEKISVKFSEIENDKKVNTRLISYNDWVEWKVDYASVAGIISWILCIQNLNWKNDKGFYSLIRLNDSEIKGAILNKLFIDESLSNKKQKEQIKAYIDLIDHRNDFIHVSSLAAKKEKVDNFRDFVYKIIECFYVNVDMNDYKFSREFNHDGSLKIGNVR